MKIKYKQYMSINRFIVKKLLSRLKELNNKFILEDVEIQQYNKTYTHLKRQLNLFNYELKSNVTLKQFVDMFI